MWDVVLIFFLVFDIHRPYCVLEFDADHAAVGDEVLEGGAECGFACIDVGAGKDASVGKDQDVVKVFLLEFVQEIGYAQVHFSE